MGYLRTIVVELRKASNLADINPRVATWHADIPSK